MTIKEINGFMIVDEPDEDVPRLERKTVKKKLIKCEKMTEKNYKSLLEENEQLKELIKIADGLIEWNTVPQVRRDWNKQKKRLIE